MLETMTMPFPRQRPVVCAAFQREELLWAVAGWARIAPGIGGWRVQVEQAAHGMGETVLVAPPTPLADPMSGPKYVITATITGAAVLFADIPRAPRRRLGEYVSLSEALHALCPLTPAQETMADALVALTGDC